jgi:hypothetical protein
MQRIRDTATDTRSLNLLSTIATGIMIAINITTETTIATTIVSSTTIAMTAHHVLRVGIKERKPDGGIATCLQARPRSPAAMTVTVGMIGTESSTTQPALGRTREP